MKMLNTFFALMFLLFYIGCSLPPERPITETELMPVLSAFQFVESPEEILAVLNKDGEVTIPAKFRGRPYFVKVLATSRGLIVEYYPRTEAPKAKQEVPKAAPAPEAPKAK